MAVYRNVHISFWQDEDMLELTPEQKYFYLYLMTNSKTNQSGCYKISKKVMQFETGYNIDTLSKLLGYFIDTEKIGYCEDTQEVILYNWLKHNWSSSPKVKSCIESNVQLIENNEFREWLINELKEVYQYSINTVPIQYRNKKKQKHKEETETEEERVSDKPLPTYTLEISNLIFKQSNTKPTKAQINAGAKIVYELEKLDNYTPDEITAVIDWGLSHEFWNDKIQSPASLRKKRNGSSDITKFAKMYGQWKSEAEKVEREAKIGEEKRKEQERKDKLAREWM